ncbi:hypothetical protein NQZ79_g8774 [Umbelopsis isabellina]|nr:hypothetical protein NQZ79_g8774 [Umbelopsis isabellina]
MSGKQHTAFRLSEKGASIKAVKSQKETVGEIDKYEVLVKVKSVALNYRDYAICTGAYPFPVKKNVVPCSDMCGEIVQVGSEVKDLKKGDKVISNFMQTTLYGPATDWGSGLGGPQDGVLQEYVVLPQQGVVKLPEGNNMTNSEAASLVCTGVTCWNALYGNIPLKPGQTVLMLGTGGVSITALQIAHAAGAKTIITSSSDEKLKTVKEKYGVTHGINYKKNPKWDEEVLKLTHGHGADYIIENGGIGTIEQSINAAAYGAIISVIGFLASIPPEKRPDVTGLALSKGANVRGIMVGSRQQLEEVTRFAVVNDIHLAVDKEFPFSDSGVFEAYEHLSKQGHIGKICIKVSE